MIGHQNIKEALAIALYGDEGIKAYCVENFGRPPLVIVDWYGAQIAPGIKEAPFIFLYSANENEMGFVDEETFEVHVVCAAKTETVERAVVHARTDTDSGLVVNGIAGKVEGLRTLVEACAREAEVGAVVRTVTREESSTVDLPLEWAKLNINFFEPETL